MKSHATHPNPGGRGRAPGRALAAAFACALVLLSALVGGERPTLAATNQSNLLIGASIDLRCSIITGPVNFGLYDPMLGTDVDAEGLISLNCNDSNFNTRLRIDRGLNGGGSAPNPTRNMAHVTAPDLLSYQLYTDAARTDVFGGTNPSGVPANGPYPMVVPVYGRIPGGQYVTSGDYADTVQVSILF